MKNGPQISLAATNKALAERNRNKAQNSKMRKPRLNEYNSPDEFLGAWIAWAFMKLLKVMFGKKDKTQDQNKTKNQGKNEESSKQPLDKMSAENHPAPAAKFNTANQFDADQEQTLLASYKSQRENAPTLQQLAQQQSLQEQDEMIQENNDIGIKLKN